MTEAPENKPNAHSDERLENAAEDRPSFASAVISETPTGLEERKRKADKELSRRPTFSIRFRIILAFSLIFAFCGIVTVWSIWALSELETKIAFLELSGNYLREIQQARRFEKNFFPYGTNLDDCIEHIDNARDILIAEETTIKKIVGTQNYQTKLQQFNAYQSFLEKLKANPSKEQTSKFEPKLRQYGAEMVSFANEFVEKERQVVRQMLKLSRRIPFYFLGVLLVIMIFMGTFFARTLLGTLARFMKYTERIGMGDFSPITPARKYQDEFSLLAKAFNRMIKELDHRHRILVESHKLRAIGTLVAGVAHELNNPLNNTMLTAAMLEEDFKTLSDEEKLEMVTDLMGETERAQGIVRNLLDFARESETTMKPLAIDELMEDSIRLVASQVKLSKVRLETAFQQDLPAVHGDEQMLKQVFVNLILNAVDVLLPRGKIFIAINNSSRKGYLSVAVTDNGPGMPEHVLEQIFDPFFTTKSKGKGTGLGLSVSQGIVRKLGGFIRVKSVVNTGTTFTVFLPTTDVPSSISAGIYRQ
ncbi:MAG: HAMP domain-containing protein [Proteobacteria bacterium]|nr:HAMP domain-containing protein [Pseudomonadota bacterium]